MFAWGGTDWDLLAVAEIICSRLKQLDLAYPEISKEQKDQLLAAKTMLEVEN